MLICAGKKRLKNKIKQRKKQKNPKRKRGKKLEKTCRNKEPLNFFLKK